MKSIRGVAESEVMAKRVRGVAVATMGGCALMVLSLAPAQARVAAVPGRAVTTLAASTAAVSDTVPGTSCPLFPADNYWNTDISDLPKHKRSAQWKSNMHPKSRLHPDFGPSYGDLPVPYGIPITVVGGSHAKKSVAFTYASESDRVKYPLGKDTLIEGGPGAGGDRHAVIVNKSTCRLYETFATRKVSGQWKAGSGATWSLTSNKLRPAGWTSADAAGLPILPGLLRLDEVKAGKVTHAIRFTTDVTSRWYVWPARHQAGSKKSHAYPPMGARFRLKASYSLAGLRGDTKVVLKAMKRYGLVLADNGSPWYFQGTSEKGWPSGLLDQLKRVKASAFVAVDTSSLKISKGSARARH